MGERAFDLLLELGFTGKKCNLRFERKSPHWPSCSSPIGRTSRSEEKPLQSPQGVEFWKTRSYRISTQQKKRVCKFKVYRDLIVQKYYDESVRNLSTNLLRRLSGDQLQKETDHLIGTSAHAPQHPMVTYTGWDGHSRPWPSWDIAPMSLSLWKS
ncbi:hypothetical protein TNCV_3703941 [Trichonephila clavipes]|nr:hypothetical protein TNCV_3703941 [Trichonephila clavipes]